MTEGCAVHGLSSGGARVPFPSSSAAVRAREAAARFSSLILRTLCCRLFSACRLAFERVAQPAKGETGARALAGLSVEVGEPARPALASLSLALLVCSPASPSHSVSPFSSAAVRPPLTRPRPLAAMSDRLDDDVLLLILDHLSPPFLKIWAYPYRQATLRHDRAGPDARRQRPAGARPPPAHDPAHRRRVDRRRAARARARGDVRGAPGPHRVARRARAQRRVRLWRRGVLSVRAPGEGGAAQGGEVARASEEGEMQCRTCRLLFLSSERSARA